MSRICIIGDIILDVTLQNNHEPLKMRLGGIVHCARALWAMNVDYSVAYFAPKCLVKQIEKYLFEFGNPELIYLGEVISSPYVMLINEAKEVGNQGYEFLLRKEIEIIYDESKLQSLLKFDEVIIISGNFEIGKVLYSLRKEARINIDFANNMDDFLAFEKAGLHFEKIFISTSSDYFLNFCKQNTTFTITSFFDNFKSLTNKIILKENRGGSRAFDFSLSQLISVTSQTQPILHSVGVGDVYNVVAVIKDRINNFEESLNYASWIATEYALTTYPEDFKKMTQRVLNIPPPEIIAMKGIQLPWELRNNINIYIAAPDFDFVDKKFIEVLCSSLIYHNFLPRRPILENGQMAVNDNDERKKEIFSKDMQLLEECQIVVAVLLYNDPGTLVEIGVAAERKMPVFVYDPYNIATNCMLTQTPNKVSSDLDVIITEVFSYSTKIISNGL